jgi:hypothetical protein
MRVVGEWCVKPCAEIMLTLAISFPIPPEAPVTIIVLPVKSGMFFVENLGFGGKLS